MKKYLFMGVYLLLAGCSLNVQVKREMVVTTDSKIVTTQQTTSQPSSQQMTTQPKSQQQETKKETTQQSLGNQKVVLSVKPQIQQVWNYCAPTTVSMMLSSRNVDVDQYTLAKEMGTYEPFGTHNRDAIRILNKHLFGYEVPTGNQAGYRLETVTNPSPQSEQMRLFKERVKKNIQDGYPMYYTMDVSKVYTGSKGEHNVIGIGYKTTPDGKDIDVLYYLDPSPNQQDKVYGGLKTITPAELFESMMTCEEPNYAW
ncbi:hypothetical protein GMA11_00700 [Granulicatella sp. zg-ZJ]|uniref:C39 family peptidase n=1 Tax=unclassified Granulicatella TaxID=2630493 RepID=UPI0013C1D1F7|nr:MULTISPECIES: C39 family peptidase [unclassified Granulicatella]MBS4749825.1 C39 family peptidase [Carnobacteriaceae bacterium zg-ZUI78]NEW61901.1 hypothetical protein [Granulicatella sp. zg-ZJ]NEW66235.1 hypothetical protein [Granulicatella sp. zg-84]QMI85924.1 C39 family peptidase [Carnobacteriaceae bacterium zg-84]